MKTITQVIREARLTITVAGAAVGVLISLVPHAARAACSVACTNLEAVSGADVTTLLAIALGEDGTCPSLTPDGPVTVDEITKAIGELDGCEAPPVCGNGVKEAPEECDNGGRCFGTNKAGQYCESDADCGEGNGICEAGIKGFWACSKDADCPASRCIRCKTVGGDNCAANCTIETSFVFLLNPPTKPGIQTTPIPPGESGSTIYSKYPAAPVLTLPISGSQTMVGGKDNGDGLIPFVVKADTVSLDRTDLIVNCLCVRGAALKTCGGTLYDEDGTLTPSCTAGFKTAPADCAALGRPPCASVYGEGNSGAGVVGCSGLPLADVTIAQTRKGPTDPGTPELTFSGEGGPGSVIIVNSSSIGSIPPPTQAGCKGTNEQIYGKDHEFCTRDDPDSTRGDPGTVPQVTGEATATWNNLDNKGETLTKSVVGRRFVCRDGYIDPAEGGVVTAFPQVGGPSPALPNDAVVTSQFFAKPPD